MLASGTGRGWPTLAVMILCLVISTQLYALHNEADEDELVQIISNHFKVVIDVNELFGLNKNNFFM